MEKIIRFQNRKVSNGKNHWFVSGYYCHLSGTIRLSRVEGDVTDLDGLEQACQKMMAFDASYR